jgi:hypothetical protein
MRRQCRDPAQAWRPLRFRAATDELGPPVTWSRSADAQAQPMSRQNVLMGFRGPGGVRQRCRIPDARLLGGNRTDPEEELQARLSQIFGDEDAADLE